MIRRFIGYRPNPPAEYIANGTAAPVDQPQYEGVVFDDGSVAVRWRTQYQSTSVWASYADFWHVHGHPEYGTRIEWLDEQTEGSVPAERQLAELREEWNLAVQWANRAEDEVRKQTERIALLRLYLRKVGSRVGVHTRTSPSNLGEIEDLGEAVLAAIEKLTGERDELKQKLTPPVEPLSVAALGQARELLRQQDRKIEALTAERDELRARVTTGGIPPATNDEDWRNRNVGRPPTAPPEDATPEPPDLEEADVRKELYSAPDQLAHESPRGVTLSHLPTGLSASCHDGQSGLQNSAIAYRKLRQLVAEHKG